VLIMPDAVVEDEDEKVSDAGAAPQFASAAGMMPTPAQAVKRTLKKVKTMFYVGTEVRSFF